MKNTRIIIITAFALLLLVSCTEQNADSLQENYNPIAFSIKDFEKEAFSDLIVLGGYKEGRWYRITDFNIGIDGKSYSKQDFLDNADLNGSEVDIDLLKGNESFKLYSETKMIKVSEVDKKPSFYVSQASTQESLMLAIDPIEADGELMIGVSGKWEALPRPLRVIEENKQYAVDLEGDGREELLILKESSTEEGLEIYLQQNDTDILIQKAPYTRPEDVEVMTLDLNGDGTFELITQYAGPAGRLSVYESRGSSLSEVLSYDSGE